MPNASIDSISCTHLSAPILAARQGINNNGDNFFSSLVPFSLSLALFLPLLLLPSTACSRTTSELVNSATEAWRNCQHYGAITAAAALTISVLVPSHLFLGRRGL